MTAEVLTVILIVVLCGGGLATFEILDRWQERRALRDAEQTDKKTPAETGVQVRAFTGPRKSWSRTKAGTSSSLMLHAASRRSGVMKSRRPMWMRCERLEPPMSQMGRYC